MRGLLAKAFGLLWLIAAAPALAAPAANPELTALVNGVQSDDARSSALRIEAMEIGVRVHGGIAETTVTSRFRNGGTERLEGRFTLQMPTGSVVAGYALDVGGQMIEGVLVDQIEARRAYEARVRERIDPGLGEVSRGFQFTTRVYPIEAGSTRTVRVRFVTPLDARRGYELPLSHPQPIDRLSILVEASGLADPPVVRLPVAGALRWRIEGGLHKAEYEATQASLQGSLVVAAPERAGPMLTGEGPGGERFFEIADAAAAGAGGDAAPPRRVAILWDRSLSRGDDDIAGEIALLERWLARVRPQTIDLLLFDSGSVERVRIGSAEALAARLAQVTYRGATSFAGIAAESVVADQCLLFTDGLVTLDRRRPLQPRCPLSIVSSAADADRPWLAALARSAGGEALQLTAENRAEVAARLGGGAVRVAEVRSASGEPIDFVLLDAPAGGWRILGRAPAGGGVVVRLANAPAGVAERVYSPAGAPASWSGASVLWASDRLAVRAASEAEDRDALIAFARTYTVAGPDISFLVLETPRDYAEAGIEPPATFPAQLASEYRDLVRQRRDEEDEERKERFEQILARWEQQKKWWETRFNPNAPADKNAREGGGIPMPAVMAAPPPSPPPPPPAPGQPPSEVAVTGTEIARPVLETAAPVAVDAEEFQADSIIVTGAASTPAPVAPSGALQPPRTQVEVADWASDRPYIAALKASRPRDRARVLAEQQAKHGALPAFWLDVSDFYYRAGARAEALRLLLSALELPTRDSETLGIVAERLIRWGDLERGIALYERMAAMDRKHPQPRRGLALALAKRAAGAKPDAARADLARAIALLTEVVTTVDDDEYEGFDIVALTELNAIIASYRRLGGTDVPLDPRLIANLHLDLRVVLEWKNEQIDVDMWLTEPNGELASYWNDDTSIGGRLSPETTDGSGPEQYMLRRAPDGTYVLKAEIYSDDPLNPNGTARVIGRLIRDFGRPNEREEMVEVELLPQKETEDADEEDAIPVAKIRIRR